MDDSDTSTSEDRTQAVSPPPGSADAGTGGQAPASGAGGAAAAVSESREEQDRRLARELSRRGVPPDEIERLLALGSPDAAAPAPAKGKAAPTTPAPVFEEEPYEPHPSITLPAFRDSSAQEQEEAGRLLIQANVARRRGQFAEAAKLCAQALEKTPSDAPALEMYGDIMQALGRVDDALYCYDRAREANPGRTSAERKFAELRLMQSRDLELLRTEEIPRNPYIAIVLSLVFPGGGQVYNGQPLKGLFIALATLVLVVLLGWTDLGFHHGLKELTMPVVGLLALAGAVYIYALVDANLGARAPKRKSGWEV